MTDLHFSPAKTADIAVPGVSLSQPSGAFCAVRHIDRCIALVRHHLDGLDAAERILQACLERAGNPPDLARQIAATARRIGEMYRSN